MNSALMFSKASDEWSTPQDTYFLLNLEFGFDWDAAANATNSKCGSYRYFGPDQKIPEYRDALTANWVVYGGQVFWLNPPYSRCREFIAKAALEAAKGCTVVCLVPSRTDTRWWHEHVWDGVRHQARPGVEIRFIRGRLKFGGATAGAPFPSVVIVFRQVLEK